MFDNGIAWLKRWFTEGNVPVKVGMLVLFAGVAALLKYATDEGWLRLPVELRLAGIALAAIAALAFGWRERTRRRSFGLALQGGAIGVLLLTAFAAFRVYQLLPAGAAFALLLVLVAGAGVLAVLQDALALAVLGILAGFAAPILISTGSGAHVVLFSYYALLNLAIFAIAWARPWRALNLLGFVFTFAIGTDLDNAQVQVQNRVAQVLPKLPEDVRRIGVTTAKASPDLLMVVHLFSPDNRYDDIYVRNYATLQVRDVLARLAPTFDPRADRMMLRKSGHLDTEPPGVQIATLTNETGVYVVKTETIFPIGHPDVQRVLRYSRWTFDAKRGRVVVEEVGQGVGT